MAKTHYDHSQNALHKIFYDFHLTNFHELGHILNHALKQWITNQRGSFKSAFCIYYKFNVIYKLSFQQTGEGCDHTTAQFKYAPESLSSFFNMIDSIFGES